MKSSPIVLIGALLAFGCGLAAAQAYAPQADIDAANQKNLKCLAKYSSDLDDGATDVKTIAKIVANSCTRERESFFKLASQGRGPLDERAAMRGLFEQDADAATFYILSNRAKKK